MSVPTLRKAFGIQVCRYYEEGDQVRRWTVGVGARTGRGVEGTRGCGWGFRFILIYLN